MIKMFIEWVNKLHAMTASKIRKGERERERERERDGRTDRERTRSDKGEKYVRGGLFFFLVFFFFAIFNCFSEIDSRARRVSFWPVVRRSRVQSVLCQNVNNKIK